MPAGHVALREVREDDLEIFFVDQLDADATQMAAFPARDREAHMAHWHKTMNDDTVIARTVLLDDRVAGNIVSWEQDGAREVGYWIGKRYWGRGVATAALIQFFSIVDTRPLQAGVAQHNVASRRVLEKCGFVISDEPDASEDDMILMVLHD